MSSFCPRCQTTVETFESSRLEDSYREVKYTQRDRNGGYVGTLEGRVPTTSNVTRTYCGRCRNAIASPWLTTEAQYEAVNTWGPLAGWLTILAAMLGCTVLTLGMGGASSVFVGVVGGGILGAIPALILYWVGRGTGRFGAVLAGAVSIVFVGFCIWGHVGTAAAHDKLVDQAGTKPATKLAPVTLADGCNARAEPTVDSDKLGWVVSGTYDVIETYKGWRRITYRNRTVWVGCTAPKNSVASDETPSYARE